MIFHDTPLAGAHVIDLEKKGDDRGFFARAFCERPFCYTRCQLTDTELICTEFTLKPSEKRFVPGAEQHLKLRK